MLRIYHVETKLVRIKLNSNYYTSFLFYFRAQSNQSCLPSTQSFQSFQDGACAHDRNSLQTTPYITTTTQLNYLTASSHSFTSLAPSLTYFDCPYMVESNEMRAHCHTDIVTSWDRIMSSLVKWRSNDNWTYTIIICWTTYRGKQDLAWISIQTVLPEV